MRSFLVGSPRSGTTLLQKLIAQHPEITTFPESHFFNTLHRHGRWQGLWSIPRRKAARESLVTFLEAVNRPDLIPSLRALNKKWTYASYGRFFVGLLDQLAEERECTAWLEKTPMHLHYIPTISKAAPDARFIHIVREGLYTIASVYAVTEAHPESWGGKRSLERCVSRWKEDIELSKKWLGHKNHYFVRYEALVRDPESVMQHVFSFLGMEYSNINKTAQSVPADQIQTPDEVWKEDVFKPLNDVDRDKYVNQLTSEERTFVERSIEGVELEVFR